MSPGLIQLRMAAREIFDETLRAVDPYAAVRIAVRLNESQLSVADFSIDIEGRKICAIAIGKAAFGMATALDKILGQGLISGVITTTAVEPGRAKLSSRWQIFHGGHPEPNDQSLAAARASFDLLNHADAERALVIFLVSGGGSAMIEWPANDDISLADLRTANKVLVNCGASIAEINSVRRAFSAVKGGRLASRAPNCDQVTLIVSDVPPGKEADVAAGPTVAPPPDAPEAGEVIARYDLQSHLPSSIVRAIEMAEPAGSLSDAFAKRFVLLDNGNALEAAAKAARRRGFITEIASDISDQPIEEGCELLSERIKALRGQHRDNSRVVCLISGGEFACPVSGDGMGGRNLETALRLATSASFHSANGVALCAGTDGIDGNSPAAGAIVDSTTVERARAIGLNADDFLRRSDSYAFFVALGDVIATGATGTNVRDVRILLAAS